MARCKYGKLKHPKAGRRCKRRAKHGKKARSSRRSRKSSPWIMGAGIGAALVGAVVLLPKVMGTGA
jgi:hypothetical protein